jgi:hypothetical protein
MKSEKHFYQSILAIPRFAHGTEPGLNQVQLSIEVTSSTLCSINPIQVMH